MPSPTEPPPLFYPEDQPPALPPGTPHGGWDPAMMQWVRDDENLRMLSIAHYVLGGFAIFFSSIFLFHVVFGLVILSHPKFFPTHIHATIPTAAASPAPGSDDARRSFDGMPAPDVKRPHVDRRDDEPPGFIGYVLVGVGSTAILLGWTIGGLIVYSGRCLAKRQRRTFSMVIGGISCLQIPFGTLLGVFTLTVLQRPSVRALYARGRTPIPTPATA